MKIGLFLANHFYEKVAGRPAVQNLCANGIRKAIAYLSGDELRRVTPLALEQMSALGVECVELFNAPEKLAVIAPCFEKFGNMDVILHKFDNEDGFPSSNMIASDDSQLRRVVQENVKWLIEIVAQMRGRAIVMHTPKLKINRSESVSMSLAAKIRRRWLDLLKKCAALAEKRKVILAVENEVCAAYPGEWRLIRTPEELAALVDEVGSDYVRCTFDVGHANVGFAPETYVNVLGRRISHVHWHDNDGTKDQHLAPGQGTINLPHILRLLLELEKQGAGEITLTMECDKPAVNYPEEFLKLKALRQSL